MVAMSQPPTTTLDEIGVERIDHAHAMFQGGSGHHRPSSAVPPLCQALVDLAWWIYMLTPVLKYCFHLTCLTPLLGESTCLPLYFVSYNVFTTYLP